MTPRISEHMNTLADRLRDFTAERDRLQMIINTSTDVDTVAYTITMWKRYAARVSDAQADWNTAWLRQCETAARLTAAGVTDADVAEPANEPQRFPGGELSKWYPANTRVIFPYSGDDEPHG